VCVFILSQFYRCPFTNNFKLAGKLLGVSTVVDTEWLLSRRQADWRRRPLGYSGLSFAHHYVRNIERRETAIFRRRTLVIIACGPESLVRSNFAARCRIPVMASASWPLSWAGILVTIRCGQLTRTCGSYMSDYCGSCLVCFFSQDTHTCLTILIIYSRLGRYGFPAATPGALCNCAGPALTAAIMYQVDNNVMEKQGVMFFTLLMFLESSFLFFAFFP